MSGSGSKSNERMAHFIIDIHTTLSKRKNTQKNRQSIKKSFIRNLNPPKKPIHAVNRASSGSVPGA